ncbi:MAG: phosphate-starvation-inducible PsiE family protein, partial [Pseudomonadota bacterium]
MDEHDFSKRMVNLIEKVERVVVTALLFSLLAIIIYATLVFIVLLVTGILGNISSSFSEQDNILTHLHEIFAGFMLVLIGIELIQTIKVYLLKNVVH